MRLSFDTYSAGAWPSVRAVSPTTFLNDLYHLDLTTLVWTPLDSSTVKGVPPAAASFPGFAASSDGAWEGFFVFGGGFWDWTANAWNGTA